MKKLFTLFITMLLMLSAEAQSFSGYYRIWNDRSKRYLSLLDNKGWAKASNGGLIYDLFAIRGLLNNDINKIESNPATIIFISGQENAYNCSSQGTSTQSITSRTFQIRQYRQNGKAVAGLYHIRAEESGAAVVLYETNDIDDYTDLDKPDSGLVVTSGSASSANWHFEKVAANTDNYFGFSPTLQANGKYYQTFYAGFSFKVVSSGVTVYYVSALYNGKAVIRPYASSAVIPAKTPVLVECSSSSAANNQIELLTSTASAPTDNLLKGVFFDYSYGDYIHIKPSSSNTSHFNRTSYVPSTMRLLRVNNAGELVFDKVLEGEDSYEPYIAANTAYLTVPSSTTDELPLMSYTDYTAGINATSVSMQQTDDKVYTLSGVRVSNTTDLPHGVYIKGGKKIVR